MKYRYRFHPDEYALGENEKFYSDMEAKGWRLVKRKHRLSKFEPCEPSAARYRIEVASPEAAGETDLRDEQIMVYADCGWEYVACRGLLHIFRAPAGSDAPEFYTDPRQQAATLKELRRQYLLSWLPAIFLLVLWLSLEMGMQGNMSAVLRELMAEVRRDWIILTGPYLFAFVNCAYGVYNNIRGGVSISRTYRRMKKGIPLDHSPKKKQFLHRIVTHAVSVIMAACVVLTIWQLVTHRKTELPMVADGPYLLLSDLGHEGERGTSRFNDDGSTVEYIRSPLAETWQTKEYIGYSVWMRQQLYRLRERDTTERFAQTLMEIAALSDPEDFQRVEVSGLDAAWVYKYDAVVIKDDLVIYVVCSGGISDNSYMIDKVLPALAEKWQ